MSFITSVINADMYRSQLLRMASDRKRAASTGASECTNCGLCCWQRPPRLTAEDVTKLAARHNLTPAEFFSAYCVADNPNHVLAPVLRRKHQEDMAGKWLSTSETYSLESPCIFLDDEQHRCTIHELRPSECAACHCWNGGNMAEFKAWGHDALQALGWDGNEWDDDDYDD